MARLHQPPPFYGTRDGICTYKMYGADFMRTASSLTGKRVKEDPVFKNTMAWAQRLAIASKLASAVYAMLPNYRRKFRLYRKLTGKAIQLLKAGKDIGEIVVELLLFVRLPKKKARKITGERTRMRLARRVNRNIAVHERVIYAIAGKRGTHQTSLNLYAVP